MRIRPFLPCACLMLSILLSSAPVLADGDAGLPASATVTVIYDAFGKDTALDKDWGYSALVEVGGKRILFDTGNDPEVFRRNVAARKIDLRKLDFVVMSHRHGDHMGGLSHLLAVNPGVTIYAPKEGFGVYGGNLPATFYRRDESLPAEQRYFDGQPPATLHFGSAWPHAKFNLVDKTTEIAPGIQLISLVSDKTGTLELRELSLAIQTREGTVLIVGCSHPGIDRIVEAAAAINPRIHVVAGGFHLVTADDAAIQAIATTLHDRYKVEWIAPGHCTGEPAFAAFHRVFGDRYLYAGLGTRLETGAITRPRAAAATLDAGERQDYRRRHLLSAESGPHHDHDGVMH